MDNSTRQQIAIPVIEMKQIFIVSIQTALDDALVMQLKSSISNILAERGGRGLIIDVSGIDVMDSYITRAIFDIASIAKLMGVETVLCGVDPMVAITLVEMGLETAGVKTRMNLEDAFDYLIDKAVAEEEEEKNADYAGFAEAPSEAQETGEVS